MLIKKLFSNKKPIQTTMIFLTEVKMKSTLFIVKSILQILILPIVIFTSSIQASSNLDVSGDGKADILWRNQVTGKNWLWTMDGVKVSESKGLNTIPLYWEIVGRGDFDGDGKSDIFWRNNNGGRNYIYLMDGFTTRVSEELNYLPNFDWKVKGVTDLNGDGKDDIVWHHQKTGRTWVYLIDGVSITTSKGLNTVADLNWNIVATGDIDGDGKGDIIWRHGTSGENYVWLMNGASIKSSYVLNTIPTSWDIVGSGDFNGDGTDDVLLRSASGVNWAYLMNEGKIGTSKQINAISDTQWQVRSLGDLDGDGKDDIFWRNQETGKTYAYLMDGISIKAKGYSNVISLDWQIISESVVPTSQADPEPEVIEPLVYYNENVSANIVQDKCILCHTSVGTAKATRLQFVDSTNPNYQELNEKALANFITSFDGAGDLLLSKVSGIDHDGGAQVLVESEDYSNLLDYLRIYDDSVGDSYNKPPTADAGGNTTVNPDISAMLDGSSSTDTDGSIVTFAWTQTSGSQVILNNADSMVATFTPTIDLEGETLSFSLNVTDNEGAMNSQGVNIYINEHPVAKADEYQIVETGHEISLSGENSTDDRVNVDYSWQQTAGTSVAMGNADTSTPTFIAYFSDDEKVTFELTVTDDMGLIDTDTVDIDVVKVNRFINDTGVNYTADMLNGNEDSCKGTEGILQDCEVGRDAQALSGELSKVGAGHAAFDYTKLDINGNALDADASKWSCVKDNFTGLVWEGKTTEGGAHHFLDSFQWGGKGAIGYDDPTKQGIYYNQWNALVDDSNENVYCGISTWRLPTIEEFSSLANKGKDAGSIDLTYFPNTVSQMYWTANPVRVNDGQAWTIHFRYGYDSIQSRAGYNYVRLVAEK